MRLPLLLLAVLVLAGCPRRADVPDTSSSNDGLETAEPADAGFPPAAPPLENVAPDAGIAEASPEERPQEAPGACTSDSQCPQGTVCEGCGEDDRRCIPGCRKNSDCSSGETCQKVQCIRCPCPPLCGS